MIKYFHEAIVLSISSTVGMDIGSVLQYSPMLVKAVTKHIIGDRYSFRLLHSFFQVNADGLKIMFGLTVHIEVTATDIVQVANVDQNKH